MRDLVKEQALLSGSIIQQIHYLVLADKREERGVYRRVPVRIMGAKHEPVRLLVNLELMKAGFPPIDIKFADRISYFTITMHLTSTM